MDTFKRKTSIRTKFYLLFIPILTITIILVAGVNIVTTFSMLKSELEQRISILSVNLREDILENLEYVPLDKFFGMEEFLVEFVEINQDISYAYIADSNRKILYHNKIGNIGRILDETIYPDTNQLKTVDHYVLHTGEYIEVLIPIHFEYLIIGTIHVGVKRAVITAKTQTMANRTVMVFLIILACTILYIFFISRLMSGNIIKLNNAIRMIGKGDLSIKAKIPGNDELGELAWTFNKMTEDLKVAQDALVGHERVKKELEIARSIQMSLLPPALEKSKYDISASMIPAEQVGGDYYDFITDAGGRRWICIGDVTSHGLIPGLIMMMAHSIISSIVKARPDITPRELVVMLNALLYQKIKERMVTEEYMTLSVMVEKDGNFTFAGAHEEILIYRSATDKFFTIRPEGLWVGIIPDITAQTKEGSFTLEKDDILLLYTDGLIEARNNKQEQFDIKRPTSIIKECRKESADIIKGKILKSVFTWCETPDDDITIVVIKRID